MRNRQKYFKENLYCFFRTDRRQVDNYGWGIKDGILLLRSVHLTEKSVFRDDVLPGNTIQHGFTLLEILVALTITGMVVGVLLSLLGGSQKLSFKGLAAVRKASQERVLVNAAALDTITRAREQLPRALDYKVRTHRLKFPTRKTKPLQYGLERVTIETKQHAIKVLRWYRYDAAH